MRSTVDPTNRVPSSTKLPDTTSPDAPDPRHRFLSRNRLIGIVSSSRKRLIGIVSSSRKRLIGIVSSSRKRLIGIVSTSRKRLIGIVSSSRKRLIGREAVHALDFRVRKHRRVELGGTG
jgi:hypothetical protein